MPKKAKVTVHPAYEIGEISPRIYSAFLEPIGNMVNGSMFNPKHPTADEKGLRRDFIDAIKSTDDFFRLCGFTLLDSLHVYGNTAPDYTISQELFDKAFEAGRKLTENGRC